MSTTGKTRALTPIFCAAFPKAPHLILILFSLNLNPSILFAKAKKAPSVLVTYVKERELADHLTYPAQVSSRVRAAVTAPVDGLVTSLTGGLGQRVHAGERLLLIKNSNPSYAPVAVEAPVSGVIGTREVTEGAHVSKGQTLITLTEPAKPFLLMEVPAAELSSITPSLEGEFRFGSRHHPTLIKVKVSGLSPLVDPTTGTATAELVPADTRTTPALPLGAIGRVSFIVNKHHGIQVPEQAIVYRGQDTFVRSVESGKAHFLPIKIGASRSGMTEVLSGLKDNTTIITRASSFITDGQSVTIQEPSVKLQQHEGTKHSVE